MEIAGLEEASRLLGGAVLGPQELAAALGFDPLAALRGDERPAVARIPFGAADLERARADGEMLVLRLARDPEGLLTMLRLAARLDGGLDPKVHKGVGYLLRDEWTIDEQPFAAAETCGTGWWLVRREPLAATLNRTYREQDAVLAALGPPPERPRRRSAAEIAFDTLCWHRAHGERLLSRAWDWSRSETIDRGYASLGEFGPDGLRVIAYSAAVRFGTLGVCPQR
ncbi:MAG: hypothetical protein E6J83_03265 [Deltaproteobacteria bacterium]|nr:MAG: hypothetical protein E6J83_03265 [Deltaproteobacteria bacterium]